MTTNTLNAVAEYKKTLAVFATQTANANAEVRITWNVWLYQRTTELAAAFGTTTYEIVAAWQMAA